MVFHNGDETQEEEDIDDEEVTLADDLLDEVGTVDDAPDEIEGFGLITEEDTATDESEEEEKTDDEESLEDDAEDVDFDTFDDVDEL